MAFLDTVNRYLAYRLKEIELRVHTWKRAKEISRAYATNRKAASGGTAFKPSAERMGRSALRFGGSAVRIGKFAAIAAGIMLLVFGVIWAIRIMPPLSSLANGKTAQTEDYAAETPAHTPAELPEDAELPETAILPEGYVEMAIAAVDTAAIAHAMVTEEAPPALPHTGDALVGIFQKEMPRGLSETGRLIFADKATKVLYIFKDMPSGWEIERAYPMATGERDGRKQVEGDKKTPEGVYHIVGRKHRSELTNLYGPAAFILDYPNEEDRRERRTGHGIWIHGSERGNIPPLFTQGCLAVSNPDILDIAGVLGLGIGVPVVVVNGTEGKKHLASVDFQKLKTRGAEAVAHYNKNQTEFEQIVRGWKTAWESKDINTYSTFYSTSTFRDGPQAWDAFRERKIRTFAMYSTINIDLENIALTELTPNLATVKFLQTYATNLNKLDNAKRLIFKREDGNWKIHREITFPKEELLL